MKIRGTVEVNGESHPFAPVYLTDSKGKVLAGGSNVLSDSNGKFEIDVPSGMEGQYVSSDFFGGVATLKIRAGKSHDLKITQSEELPEVKIVVGGKRNWTKIALISAGVLIGLSGVAYAVYRLKRK